LKGLLFEQGRFTGNVAASRIYFIEKESVKILEKRNQLLKNES
jgi:hypothetical protein